MGMVIFLLEEASMKAFLDSYLPRLLPDMDFLCIKHEGKQDLEKSVPRKLKAWKNALFVVVRDNDGADCLTIKRRLQTLCEQGGRPDTLIRIACQELESWYLGTPETLSTVYALPRLANIGRKSKFRNPDRLGSPSTELVKLVPEFRKMDGARRMGTAMPLNESNNRSQSFCVFLSGIRRLAKHSAGRSTT